MSRDRGIRLQNALAAYLRAWWPSAESAGSGRPGTDVLGTPGVVWECKTSGKGSRNIGAWIDQARSHVVGNGQVPAIVVYFPAGLGERTTDHAVAMLPLGELVGLLVAGGYAPERTQA